jgi:hypothetical protein
METREERGWGCVGRSTELVGFFNHFFFVKSLEKKFFKRNERNDVTKDLDLKELGVRCV